MVNLVIVITLTSYSFGIALVITDALEDTLAAKLKWNDNEKENYITVLTCSSALGLMIGSLLSSKIV